VNRDELAAANEAVHRDVNEAIERGRWPAEHQAISFRCECGRAGCTDLIELTRDEYEHVRSSGRRFALVAGHEDPSVEDVVETHPGYAVVQKRGQAGEVAEETDPRS
jgi:hypothetical protein